MKRIPFLALAALFLLGVPLRLPQLKVPELHGLQFPMTACLGAGPDLSAPATIGTTAPPGDLDALSPLSGAASSGLHVSPPGPAMHFGSRKVLDACWSNEELEGRASSGIGVIPSDAPGSGPTPEDIPSPPALGRVPGHGYSVRSVEPFHARRIVALTFDLCEAEKEKSGYHAEIVNLLRKGAVKATFFAGGKWMRSHPRETLQLMADPLFEIGNHSWNHRNLTTLDDAAATGQLGRTQAQYAELRRRMEGMPCVRRAGVGEMDQIPLLPRLFRFPYGRCTRDGLRVVEEHNLVAIQWDVVSGDPSAQQTPERMSSLVLRQVKPGSIVIFHANGRGVHTARALPRILSGLLAQGYEFMTVSELLASGRPVTSTECYEWKPGDNLRYDRLKGGR